MLARVLSILAPPLCLSCGGDAGRAAPLCGACRGALAGSALARPSTANGVHVWSAFAYDGPAGALVRGLKFGGRIVLADVMAAQMAAQAPAALWSGALVPVPMHPARRRRRGFNQAELLARALAKRTRLPLADCLRRSGDAVPQMTRGRADRLGAYAHDFRASGVPERAVLVDDVVTTGATLAACGRALRAAGCRRFVAVTYASTPGR